MELNTQIWGTQNEWSLDTDTFSETNSPYPAYTGKYKYLKDYRAAQVFDFGTEIDNTILYCGQAAGVSPLGGAAAFYYNDNFEGTPEPYIQRNETVSTFLASIGNSQTYNTGAATSIAATALTTILYYKGGVNGGANTRWIIDGGEYITGGDDWYNVADMTAPIVDFNPKCLFGVIYVVAGNENDGVTTMTLRQLETGNYSNYKIYKAFMRAATVDTVSGSSPYTTSFTETYSSSLTPNKKGLGFIDFTPWKMEEKDYVNYIQNGRPISNYPSIPLFGFDLGVVNLYHYNKFGFSWRSYHYVSNGSERDWAASFSQAPIFYGATYATFTDVYANKDTSYTDVSFIGYMENTAENRENLRKMAACYGIYFTDYNATDDSTLFDNDNRYTNEHMCLGLLRDGVGYGDYTRGAGNIDNPAYNWTSSHQSGYDPSAGHDPNTYSNETTFNSLSAQANLTKRYALNKSNVEQLSTDLYDIVDDLSTIQGVKDYDHFPEKVIDNFLVTSPIDCIISLKRFPFDIPHTGVASKTPVKLGKTSGNAEGYATYDSIATVLFEGKKIFPRFGNSFLDYSPYTEYELYIPFCGITKINAGDLIGHTLNVKLTIDLITGGCTAYIMADSLVIETAIGTCATEMQITGINSAQMDASIQNAITNARNAKTQQEVTMLSPISVGGLITSVSNPWKTAGSIAEAKTNRVQADYNLQNIQTPIHLMGNAGGSAAWVQEFNCRLMIYYPEGDAINGVIPPELANLETYGHTTGFATVDNTTIGAYGDAPAKYVQAINPILDFSATENEKDMIRTLLAEGVYVDLIQIEP